MNEGLHSRSSRVVRSLSSLKCPTMPSVNGLSPRLIYNLTLLSSISTSSFSSPVTPIVNESGRIRIRTRA